MVPRRRLKPLPGRASAVLNVGFLLVTAHRRSLIELRMVLLNVNIKKKPDNQKKKKRGVAIPLRGNSTHPALRRLIYSRSLWFNNFLSFGLTTVDRRLTAQEVAGRQRQRDRERQRRKAERQTGKEGGKRGEREDLLRAPAREKEETTSN